MKGKLDKEKKIVLYGAGQKTHSIYHALCMSGYTIAYCVITNDSVKESDFEEVKVYPFLKKKDEILEKGYQLVIACAQKSETDIAENIERNGIYKYWKTNEMPWSVDFNDYKNFSPQEYRDIIRKKYNANEKKYASDEKIRIFVKEDIRPCMKEKKILFLLTCASPRAFKIIGSLYRNGYDVEIIMWANATYLTAAKYKEFGEISNQIRVCIDVEEVMLFCAATDAGILHIFSDANSDIELPQILINCKEIFPKIVFDEYDVMVGMRRDIPKRTMEAEKFCLQHADGLCSRYVCMEYLEDAGYEICKKRIYFIDCCNDSANMNLSRKSDKDALHLVFAGSLFSGKEYKTGKFGRFLEFGILCKDNKVHLHLYPVQYDESKLYEYIEMEKVNPYFHLHHPVSAQELAQELSQYDYGVDSVQMGALEYAEKIGSWNKEGCIYSSANKLYDYLDAGLPIVAALPVKQAEMFEQDGVLIRKYDEDVDFEELRQKRDEMKKRVVEVQKKYSVSNQIFALIEFYNNL